MNNLSDLNLNNALRTLDLLGGAVRLDLGLYSYLWYSDALPMNLQVIESLWKVLKTRVLRVPRAGRLK